MNSKQQHNDFDIPKKHEKIHWKADGTKGVKGGTKEGAIWKEHNLVFEREEWN